MLQKFIRRLLIRRHYWRHVGFDELSELYVSSMFRSLALSLIGIFAPVYLLQQGFSIAQILFFYGVLFATRVPLDVVAGYAVAAWGPKHTLILSNYLQIIASAMLMTLPLYHWPLWLVGIIWGMALSFFFIAYHVDFSKIKHSDHGGKELGWMSIMERVGRAVGPVCGGILATFFGAQYTFMAAGVILLAGLVPLLMSAEPTRTHQKLDFKGLRPWMMKRTILVTSAITVENTVSTIFWPLFLGAYVLSGYVYAELGLLSSVSMIFSTFAAYGIGRLVDNHHGRSLLRVSATSNALLHLFRPFTSGIPMAMGINITNEMVTVGYWLPLYKGIYDNADSQTGHRIVFIVTFECIGEVCKAAVCFGLAAAAMHVSGRTAINTGFVIGGIASSLIMFERFRALDGWRSFYKQEA
jgi:MFS family permease